MNSIYDYKAITMQGTELSMADLKGKVLLIVNTASKHLKTCIRNMKVKDLLL